MKKDRTTIAITMIFAGSVFITSGKFCNFENDAKLYFTVLSSLILLIVIFFFRKGFSSLVSSYRSIDLALCISVVGAINAIYGWLQYYGVMISHHSDFAVTGSFENPAGYAAVQTLVFSISLYYALSKTSKSAKAIFIASSFLMLSSIVISHSRTAIIAVIVSSTIVCYCEVHHFRRIVSKKWVIAIMALSVVVIIISLYLWKKDSADGRLFIWNNCLTMIADKPLFGFGHNGFTGNYMNYQAAYFSLHPDSQYAALADNIIHPFNEYLKLTVEYGIVGLLISVVLLVLIVINIVKKNHSQKGLLIALLASFMIFCSFSYPFHYASVWFLLFYLFILILPDAILEKTTLKSVRYSIITILIIAFGLSSFMMYNDMKWAEISKRSLMGKTEKMLPYYAKMKGVKSHDPLFLYNYSAELNVVGRYEESLSIIDEYLPYLNDYDVLILMGDDYTKLGRTEEAFKVYKKASLMIPNRFVPLYNIMKLYQSINDNDSARIIAEQIVYKPVKIKSVSISAIIDDAFLILNKDNK